MRLADAAKPAPQVVIDVDDDRDTGMWTLQSPLSASGWDLLVDSYGKLYRHTGVQNAWRWAPVSAASSFKSTAQALRICVPTSVLTGPRQTIRIAALSGDHEWLPAAFLPGAAYPADTAANAPGTAPPAAATVPAPLAFHYGFRPWVVGPCGDRASLECAVNAYSRFRHVVFGSGLEDAGHPSHGRAGELLHAIRRVSPGTEIWGYVSLIGPPAVDGRRPTVYTTDEIERKAGAWREMGATGIFLDEADICRPSIQSCARGPKGQRIEIARARQTAVVDAIHALGLPVFANGFSVPDVLATVAGMPSPLGGGAPGRAADMFLLENPTVSAGKPVTGLAGHASSARWSLALDARTRLGVRLAAVDTLDGRVEHAEYSTLFAAGWSRAEEARIDAYGFTNASYSSAPDVATDLAPPAADLERLAARNASSNGRTSR